MDFEGNNNTIEQRLREIDRQIEDKRDEQDRLKDEIEAFREDGEKEGIGDAIFDSGSDLISSEEDIETQRQRIDEIDREIADLERERVALVDNN